MLKPISGIMLMLLAQNAAAFETVTLFQAPLSSLHSFVMPDKMLLKNTLGQTHVLKEIRQTVMDKQTVIRYQQFYQGLPVVGAQAIVVNANKNKTFSAVNSRVNASLIKDIQLNTQPDITALQAQQLAQKIYSEQKKSTIFTGESSQLQIRKDSSNALRLTWLVSFRTTLKDKPEWPFFVIDAHNQEVISQWNNIQNYRDNGPGGNEKTQEYWYGKDQLPALDVSQEALVLCYLKNSNVRVVNLRSSWDWNSRIVTPYRYICGRNTEDKINGGFSPLNDAFFSGQVVFDTYKKWYGLQVLQTADGKPMPMVMRVHFGTAFDNAFWDGQTMSFGDGDYFYPMVTLDIAGHEVSHGFTEQHSNLEYHDQSGALNESFSDMAGQAARAYLLATSPLIYQKMFLNAQTVTWGIGETIIKGDAEKALRFMDTPSRDGSSVDCLDRTLAMQSGSTCAITYEELLAYTSRISDPDDRQNFIVHTASGLFNKAFFLLAEQMGIKKAFHIAVRANTSYWTPLVDFKTAACGMLYAAQDLKQNVSTVKTAFAQVGIDVESCG